MMGEIKGEMMGEIKLQVPINRGLRRFRWERGDVFDNQSLFFNKRRLLFNNQPLLFNNQSLLNVLF